MFAIVAVPFETFRQLPSPQHRWLLTCFNRYVDKAGRAYPTLRQLATDARMSLSTVCRRMKEMADLGVFHRERKGVGRYLYQLAEAYRPRWPGRVSGAERHVPQKEAHKSNPNKQDKNSDHERGLADDRPKWEARLRSWRKSRFWLPYWGPKPNELGCFAPASLLTDVLPGREGAGRPRVETS